MPLDNDQRNVISRHLKDRTSDCFYAELCFKQLDLNQDGCGNSLFRVDWGFLDVIIVVVSVAFGSTLEPRSSRGD